jgi:glycosyltransferase involved in cell wall biosynthesis
MEALSAGCCVVASRTPPVEEVMRHEDNGFLVDFFDTAAWVEEIVGALDPSARHGRVREAARKTVMRHYDLNTVSLPAYLALAQGLVGGGTPVATAGS